MLILASLMTVGDSDSNVSSLIFMGVVSGLISSLSFYVIIQLVRPRISISPRFSVSPGNPEGRGEVVSFKIMNLRYSRIVDVNIRVYAESGLGSDGRGPEGRPRIREPLKFVKQDKIIRKRRLWDAYFDNCIRVRVDYLDLISTMARFQGGRYAIEVFGRDSLTGAGRFFRKEIPIRISSFSPGQFEHGNSIQINNDGISDLKKFVANVAIVEELYRSDANDSQNEDVIEWII